MRTFVKGWRRKAGLVTLMLSIALFLAWMRSMIVTDTWWICIGGEFHQIHSLRGYFWWESRDCEETLKWSWSTYPTQYWEDIGTQIVLVEDSGSTRLLRLAYWPFVVALTVLSACLIFWPNKQVKLPSP